MRCFHIHVGVEDIAKSIQFYSTLFGQPPTKSKEDLGVYDEGESESGCCG